MASKSALLDRELCRNWGLERRGAGVLRQRNMGRRAANRNELMVAALTGQGHDGKTRVAMRSAEARTKSR
jgi:hypothetical protein